MDAPSAEREDAEGIIVRGTATTGQTVDVEITEQVVYFTQRRLNGQGAWGRILLQEGLVRLEAEWASYEG